MSDFVSQLTLFGAFLTLAAFALGTLISRRLRLPFLTPFLIAVVLVIGFLVAFRVDYAVYNQGAQYLSCFITPATVCLAIPLYQTMPLLKQHWRGVLLGILAGVVTNLSVILALSSLFRLNIEQFATLLPKSVTTAISMGISQELGGIVSITVAATTITGITGNALCGLVCHWCRITNPIARGAAIGTASHVIGTARAMEISETDGAFSGLSIAVAGLLTVVFAPLFLSVY